MSWKKQKPLNGRVVGCGTCGYKEGVAGLGMRIAVGFGDAQLKKNGVIVWNEGNEEWEDCMTVAQAEELAKKDPDNDWRIWLYAPLSEIEYQRQGENEWVLIKTGMGFA